MPVPETNGEEWDRLEPASALDVLVELVIHGEYNGLERAKRTKDGLELRAAAVGVFEVVSFPMTKCQAQQTLQNFVRKEETRQAIVQAMLLSEGAGI